MKIGWIYKQYAEDDEWLFSKTEPESWRSCVTMIVYSEIEE